MPLDVKTLFLLNVVVATVSAGLCMLSWLHHRDMPGLRGWSLGLVVGGAGGLAVSLRPPGVDNLVLVVAGNGLIVAGYALVWTSVRRFNQRPREVGLPLATTLLFAVPFAVVALAGADVRLRVAIVSATIAGLSLLAAAEAIRPWRSDPLGARLPTALGFAVNAAAMLLRAGLALLAPAAAPDSPFFDPTAGLALFANTICIIAVTLGLLMMTNERLSRRYEALASTDELTELPNRRFFLEQGQRLVSRATRDGAPCSVLMIDLDRFSEVNGSFGHPGGDRALAAFAHFARDSLRPSDLIARYGGEEFCVVLAGTPAGEAVAVAERLRRGAERLAIAAGGRTIAITVSIGVAEVADGELRSAIRSADRALYRAKALGRNRVCSAADEAALATAP